MIVWKKHLRFTWMVYAVFVVMIHEVRASEGLRREALQTRTSVPTNVEDSRMSQETPFYCNAKALSKTDRERYNELTNRLREARIETKELSDGFAFRLKSEALSLPELAEWISYERRCCPFFGFEIELQRDNGPLWLKLRGRDGVKQFIRSEFGVRQ